MKILMYMVTPGGLTGAPRRTLTLAKALQDRNIDVCIGSNSDSQLLSEARKLGLQTIDIDPVGVLALRQGALFRGGVIFKLRIIFGLIVQHLRFVKAVRDASVDAVWVRGSKGIAFIGVGGLLINKPLVWDVDYELPSRGAVRLMHRFGLWLSSSVVYQYQSAAVSIFGVRLADKYRHKFTAIIPGVELEVLNSVRERRRLRKSNKQEPFNILQVGTVCDRKNQLFLINALQHLSLGELDKKVRIMLAGGLSDEDYVAKVKFSITEKGLDSFVELLGWRDDVHELMVNTDLLVMPSKDEGVPNTIQEAMYIGLPVLVSDKGGMPEIVNDGQNGWILSLETPSDWTQRISTCINTSAVCNKVGIKASQYAEKHFGTDEWGQKYAQLIFESSGAEAQDKVTL